MPMKSLEIDLKSSILIWAGPKPAQISNSVPEKWLTVRIIYNNFGSAAPVGSLQRHAIL